MSKEYVNRVATAIVDQLRNGTAPWIRPWRSGERYLPHNPISGHQYRGINAVWLMAQSQERGYQQTQWMTYRQAESVGAYVRRGEKGTTIQYWKWEGTRPLVDESGQARVDERGNQRTERTQYTRPRVFTATVFNAEQIEGLAATLSVGNNAPEWERHERAERLLQASGVRILHRAQDRAFYDVHSDEIVLPFRAQFATADGYYATGLHEVGHSTGHPSRLNRDLRHPFGSVEYAREELRAEIASLMMGDELGIGHDPGQHVSYVGSWIKVLQDNPLEIFRAASAAEKIQAYVLGLAQQRTAEQEQPRSQPVARGDRMDPNIVAATLNEDLEPHGLQVSFSQSDSSRDSGFELHRADGSPVIVASADSSGVTLPKRFEGKVTSAEIVAWWARHQATAATLMQTPVSLVLTDSRWDFAHFRSYKGASLDEALRVHGLDTVAHVVGLEQETFLSSATHSLAPVFGIRPADGDVALDVYLECRVLANSFVAIADQLVAENALSADRYVLTDWKNGERRKVSEYASLVDAVRAFKRGHPFESPALYLKASADQDFDARLLAPKDWNNLDTAIRYRNDTAAHSLASTEWYNDGSSLRYVSRIPELATLINTPDNHHDMDILRVAAVKAIAQFKATHFQVGSTPQPGLKPIVLDLRISTAAAEERANISANRDRYVVARTQVDTYVRTKVSEHDSLLEAIESLRQWDIEDRPELYLKWRNDHTFDERFADQDLPDFRRWTHRDDTTLRPLLRVVWNEDETGLLYASPIVALEELALAPYGNDPEQRTSAALEGIARFRATHYHTGHIATERVNLRVPYRERELADRAGADWDKVARTWYAPPGADLDALARWRVEPNQQVSDSIAVDPQQEFAEALRRAGLVLEGAPVMDGVLHRVRVEGDRGAERSGAYVGHLDGYPAGWVQNYKTGLKTNWKSEFRGGHSLGDRDRQRLQEEASARLELRQKARAEEQEKVARAAAAELSDSPVAADSHAYLQSKGFPDNAHLLRVDRFGNLLVPAHDIDGQVWSYQRISPTGEKMFRKGGRIDGCHVLLKGEQGELKNSDPAGLYVQETVLIVVEGYATGRTLQGASGLPVAVAFSSGNLLAVAQSYRQRFPHLNIIIAGDNDHRQSLKKLPNGDSKRNVGKEAAEMAATAVGGYALLPSFATEEYGTDWNDYEQLHGSEATLSHIKDGVTLALVTIDAQRAAEGLHRFPVHEREPDHKPRSGAEIGYVTAPTLEEAREKFRRGEWIATASRAAFSVSLVDVFEPDKPEVDRETANTQRTIDSDRLRLLDARQTGHNGELVAENVVFDEAAAQRPEKPVQVRAALDMIREAAGGEADRQAVREPHRDRRQHRGR